MTTLFARFPLSAAGINLTVVLLYFVIALSKSFYRNFIVEKVLINFAGKSQVFSVSCQFLEIQNGWLTAYILYTLEEVKGGKQFLFHDS